MECCLCHPTGRCRPALDVIVVVILGTLSMAALKTSMVLYAQGVVSGVVIAVAVLVSTLQIGARR